MLAAAGAWLGWQALPWVVVGASLGGIAAALIAALLGLNPPPVDGVIGPLANARQ